MVRVRARARDGSAQPVICQLQFPPGWRSSIETFKGRRLRGPSPPFPASCRLPPSHSVPTRNFKTFLLKLLSPVHNPTLFSHQPALGNLSAPPGTPGGSQTSCPEVVDNVVFSFECKFVSGQDSGKVLPLQPFLQLRQALVFCVLVNK